MKLNYRNYSVSVYLGGRELSFCRDNFLDFLETSKMENKVLGSVYAEICYRMSVSLIEGIDYVDNLPSWDEISNNKERNIETSYAFQAHEYMRSFLFQSYDGVMEGDGLLSRLQDASNPPLLRPLLLLGVSTCQLNMHFVTTYRNLNNFMRRCFMRVSFPSNWFGSTRTLNLWQEELGLFSLLRNIRKPTRLHSKTSTFCLRQHEWNLQILTKHGLSTRKQSSLQLTTSSHM